jgi:transcriptional regulator with XRE-family HTH domain
MDALSKKLRQMRGSTYQKDVALDLGIPPQTYSAYENGRDPDLLMLAALATYYGCSVDYLIGLSDEPTPHTEQELRWEISELKRKNMEAQQYLSMAAKAAGWLPELQGIGGTSAKRPQPYEQVSLDEVAPEVAGS